MVSKLVLGAGIAEFVNYERKGIAEYSANEFNKRSFKGIRDKGIC